MKITHTDVIRQLLDEIGLYIVPAIKGTMFTLNIIIGIAHQESYTKVIPALRKGAAMKDILRNFTGDRGHGRSVFQIDDRWHKKWIDTGNWKMHHLAAYKCVEILDQMKRTLEAYGWTEEKLGEYLFLRSVIASYNCGANNVIKALNKNKFNPDRYTYDGDYSEKVYGFSIIANQIIEKEKFYAKKGITK